jgi:hypothetical protein
LIPELDRNRPGRLTGRDQLGSLGWQAPVDVLEGEADGLSTPTHELQLDTFLG